VGSIGRTKPDGPSHRWPGARAAVQLAPRRRERLGLEARRSPPTTASIYSSALPTVLTRLAAPPPISSPTHTRTSRRALLIDRPTHNQGPIRKDDRKSRDRQRPRGRCRPHEAMRGCATRRWAAPAARSAAGASPQAAPSNQTQTQTQTHSSQTEPNPIRSDQIGVRPSRRGLRSRATRRQGKARQGPMGPEGRLHEYPSPSRSARLG
jgi:hypothetical protein